MTSRRSRRLRPALAYLVAMIVAVVHTGPAAAATAPARVCASPTGLISTLGVFDPDASELTDPVDGQLYVETYGVGKGIARDSTEPPTLRVTSRRGIPTRWAICAGGRLVTDLPVERVRGARVLGLSVNASRIAWRTSRATGRGTLYVGRFDGGRLRIERRTSNRAIRANREVNGRLVVMPNGTTAWSLEDRGRAGVWLWPAGRSPRRVARLAVGPTDYPSTDVRVVDDGHVLLGASERLAAYAAPSPGICPKPNGSRAVELDGSKLFVVDGFLLGSDETESSSWLLTCDRESGRYLRPRLYESGSQRYAGGFGTRPTAAFKTAGAIVVREDVDKIADTPPGVTATIVVPGVDRSFRSGPPSGPGISPFPAGAPATTPASPEPPSVRVLPGAVAWATDVSDGAGTITGTEIWLADGAGVRRVGREPTAPGGLPRGTGVALELTPTAVSWASASGRAAVPARPVTGDTIRAVDLSTRS